MNTDRIRLSKLCSEFLGVTEAEILSISRTAPRRYFVWSIPKRTGGERTVCHPAKELKPIQRFFQSEILPMFKVHDSATAYKRGSSIKINAMSHAHSRVIVKFDFANFFPSLTVNHWRRFLNVHAQDWTAADIEFSSNVMFWGAGGRAPNQLAIGSITSPQVSNILCFNIDFYLSRFSNSRGIVYTRYADDITFSSTENLDPYELRHQIVTATRAARFTSLELNAAKTVLAGNGTKRVVTGLIITPDGRISIGRDRKRLIRSMVERFNHNKEMTVTIPQLKGLIAFALDVEPEFVNSLERSFGKEIIDRILSRSGS